MERNCHLIPFLLVPIFRQRNPDLSCDPMRLGHLHVSNQIRPSTVPSALVDESYSEVGDR